MSVQNPNMKDTKETILKAYNNALAKIQQLEGSKMNPAAELKAKEIANVIASADDVATTGLVEASVASLKKELGSILDGIAGDVTEQLKKYTDVQKAIEEKEKLLQELFGIEAEAYALVALINSKEQIAREYDETHSARVLDAEQQLNKLRMFATEERNNIQKELDETRKKIAVERKREEEEYQYSTKRKRQQEEDAFQDELNAKKRDFNEKCEEFTKSLNAREADLDEREVNVEKRETYIEELEDVISVLKATKDDAIAQAVEQAKKDANSSFYREKASIERDAKHQVELAESKNVTLQNALDKAEATIEALNEKLEKAYAELRDLAKSTVDNAGNKQVITQLESIIKGQKASN
jgi:DNA repair exonuclease SbcCD ATPase subunit